MRAILIDWLIEVHFRFSLKPETLFLTVNIIDRYISHVHIERSKLQLVGVAALFISCKYEEILCPDLKDFVYITDKTYDKKEILNMEIDILNALNFNLTMPSSLRFFELLSLNFRFNDVEIMYGRYLLELFLIDPKMNKYSPSLIALAAAYIVMKINSGNHRELYNLVNTQVKNGSSKHLKECAKEIYYLVQNPENLYLQAVFKKFSTATYLEVAQNGCKS